MDSSIPQPHVDEDDTSSEPSDLTVSGHERSDDLMDDDDASRANGESCSRTEKKSWSSSISRRLYRKAWTLCSVAALVCISLLTTRIASPYGRPDNHLNITLVGLQQFHEHQQRSRAAIGSSAAKTKKKTKTKNGQRDDPLRDFRMGKPVSAVDTPFDINGPPVDLPPGVTIRKIKRREVGASDEFIIRQGPDPPSVQQQHHQTVKKTEAVTAPQHAVDSLQCGESVKNFVVNATDGKDECDGLIKAFDKACNNDDETEETELLASGNRRLKLKQRTKLSDKLGLGSYNRRWHTLVYKSSRDFGWAMSLMPRRWFQRVPVGHAIVDAWADASYVTDHNLEQYCLHNERITMRQASRLLARRKLDEALNNQTSASKNTEPVTTLKLPISHKMSEKSANDALLLQQGDKVIKQANETIAAANEEAAKSKKSIAETSAAIMEVLSDPSSVAARTCCTSILNVYQDLCSSDEEEQVSDSKLFFLVLVMALCGMVKSLIRYFKIVWLPEPAGCIIVGVLSGYALEYFPHHNISFDGNWFLRILVPPIVFEAALSIDKRSFNSHIIPIIIYSVVGTLVATVLTAEIVHNGTNLFSRFCTPIPYVEALTFGALISSIDPIAVLSVLNNMGMNDTDTIYVLIFGESLLNDGVAIVLFHTLVHFLDENLVIDDDAIMAAVVHFFVVAFGSLLVGVASGMLGTVYYWIFHGCQTPLVEVLMFFCWALLPYYICDGIGWSGIVASVAVGFVMDIHILGQRRPNGQPLVDDVGENQIMDLSERTTSYDSSVVQKEKPLERLRRRIFSSSHGHLSHEAKTHIGFVTEIISTAMETAIFAYLGFFLFSHRYHWNAFHMVIAVLGCCLSRAAMIPSLGMVANWITRIQQRSAQCKAQQNPAGTAKKTVGVIIDKRMQIVLWFAGLRGAMSFALVEHIPLYDSYSSEGTRLKPELKAMTSASIIFTVFVLGGYTYYVMEKLGIAPSNRSGNSLGGEGVSLVRNPAGHKPEEDEDGIISNMSDAKSSHATTFRRKHNTILSV